MMDPNIIKTFKDAVNNNGYLVETLSKAITKQSTESKKLNEKCLKQEKDIGVMVQAALETKNSSVVRNFSSAISTNLEKMSQLVIERDQLRNALKEERGKNIRLSGQLDQLNNQIQQDFLKRIAVEQERDKLREDWKKEKEINSKLYSDNTRLLQQNIQLQTEMQKLRDEQKTINMEKAERQQEQRRSTSQQNLAPPAIPAPPPLKTSAQQQKPIEEQQQQRVETNNTQLVTKGGQMHNFQNGNDSGKFVFVGNFTTFPDYLSSDNVEYIKYCKSNLGSLVHNISSYKKEMFVLTWWKCMNTTSGYADDYANLLPFCQKWKTLRSDGEIHCLYWYSGGDSPSEPDKELVSLLTTCNKYVFTDCESDLCAYRQYWPKFVDTMLSENFKTKFPK